MSRMTALIFVAALAVVATDPFSMAPAAADSHRCFRVAVLTITPHGQTDEDAQASMGGWFPLICRHGAKFAQTGRPVDVDVNGKTLAVQGRLHGNLRAECRTGRPGKPVDIERRSPDP